MPHCLPYNRPKSVLSPFSKIFEKILYDRLNKYFFSNSIISKEQLGFKVGHSTTHVITDVISKLQTYRDNKNFTCLILVDLSKAFDTVDHGILLNILEKYGVRGNVLKLLKSYLNNRQQVVHIQNTFFVSHYVRCGVPQGSVICSRTFVILHLY